MSTIRVTDPNDFFSGLLSEYAWDITSSKEITYSIPNAGSRFTFGYGGGEPDNWDPLRGPQIQAFESILELVESYTQIDFVEVNESFFNYGTIRIAFSQLVEDDNSGAWAYYPARFGEEGGDIWLNPGNYQEDAVEGSWLFSTIIHELGHALGLSHSFEADWPFPEVPTEFDSSQYTIMSYTDGPDYHHDDYPTTFMPLDIAALQYMYGVNNEYNNSDTVYTFTNSTVIQTIWDAGGTDVFDFSSVTSGGIEANLGQGQYSSVGVYSGGPQSRTNNLAVAYGTEIENLIGSNNGDQLIGNELNNRIEGRGGDDWIQALTGANMVDGGGGTDTVVLAGNSADWTWDFSINTGSGNGIARYLDTSDQIELVNVETIKFDDSEKSFAAILAENSPEPEVVAMVVDPDEYLWDNDLISVEEVLVSAEDAQVYRLYMGALNRIPDQDGLAWWAEQINQGRLLESMAAGFYWSEEFQTLADADSNGQVSSNELLDHLYATVLEREVDEEGYGWWLEQLTTGSYSEEKVLTDFTQSNEYVMLSLNTVAAFEFLS
ncbi:DUF4214 domain-containing protein [Motiliproteus sp. MSK22-1]|uniref:DUF4214 domain-containing protein n=1 Tax=Motiliproteus sp. MSK22-1 TaxID=1897630 RepID=UPI000975F1F3|nr:DUF4214 domain-containing protein [Motiliproteus sp. MSK22-1]OMH30401.1 hypothetical protein BGP75_18670 [Motiliproteus sp. MSK22-1]